MTLPPAAPVDTSVAVSDPGHAVAALLPPFGFIRRLDADADSALFAEALTRPLATGEDLRFVHRLPDGTAVAVFAHKLAWDSQFFGYGVARIDAIVPASPSDRAMLDYGPAVAALLGRAAEKEITYLFAPVDARDVTTLRALGDAGFALIETRLYYHRKLDDFVPKHRYPVRAATAADIHSLGCTARDTVNPYDRFHADPFIEKAQADRLMYTWVEASILEGFADITIVPDAAQPSAFCTVKYHKDKWDRWRLRLAQPVFSAVAPESKGWYLKLISEISLHLKEIGAEHAYMVTQATNLPVIRTWESLGYRYGKTEHILRRIIPST